MSYQDFDESFSLVGKTALITGSNSGIGLEIAKMYARKGANIIGFDLESASDLQQYIIDQGVRCTLLQGDITDRIQIESAVQNVIKEYGTIDILVNCAGIGIIDKAENLSEEIWDKTMSVNLKGSFLMTQTVGREMLKNKSGKIINIASQAGIVALDQHMAYGCSKAALIHMTKQFAFEWASRNINVNAISPTIILTPLGRRVWENPAGDAFKQTIPARRFGYPEEVAACAVFLASEAASLINGENLVIDGGYTIG